MLYPVELQYSKSHEWVKVEDGVTVVGISDFAQNALGDVVFVNLPAEGDGVTAGDAFGDVESVKAVSDLVSPRHRHGVRRQRGAAGRAGEAEQRIPTAHGSSRWRTWTGSEELLDAAAYEAFCAEGGLSDGQLRSLDRDAAARKCSVPWVLQQHPRPVPGRAGADAPHRAAAYPCRR